MAGSDTATFSDQNAAAWFRIPCSRTSPRTKTFDVGLRGSTPTAARSAWIPADVWPGDATGHCNGLCSRPPTDPSRPQAEMVTRTALPFALGSCYFPALNPIFCAMKWRYIFCTAQATHARGYNGSTAPSLWLTPHKAGWTVRPTHECYDDCQA